VAHYRWRWPVWKVLCACVPLITVDLLFFGSNLLKFSSGGYFPVTIAVVLVLSWIFVVEPLTERARNTSELVPSRSQVLGRRLELLARKDSIVKDLERTNGNIERASARFLTEAAPAVAASELQKLTKEMAAQAATEIRSERILPPVERGEVLEIPVEIAVSGEVRQLVDLLARLETAPKMLTVQDLRIRVVNVSQPKELLATLTVSGFILPGKSKT